MAKGDAQEVGFQDGGCFSRFLKREQINNQTLIAFLKLTLTLTLTTIYECNECLVVDSFLF